MTYGYGYTAPPPPPARRPVRMLVVGIVLLVLGLAGISVAVVQGVRSTVGAVSDAFDVSGQLVAKADVPGTATAQLTPGEYVVVALGHGLVAPGPTTSTSSSRYGSGTTDGLTALPFARPDVTVTDPSGAPVALRDPGVSSLVSTPSLDAVAVHDFTVPTAGTYTLDVAGSGTDVTQVGVRPAVDVGNVVRSAATWVVVGLVSGLLVVLGIGLTIAGAVRRARSR